MGQACSGAPGVIVVNKVPSLNKYVIRIYINKYIIKCQRVWGGVGKSVKKRKAGKQMEGK